MTRTAPSVLAAASILLPVLASGQPAFQPPPDAFQTPSGNVHCRFAAGRLRCEVLEHAYATPPRPEGCAAWGGQLALRPEGAPETPCVAPRVRDDAAFVLGYGAKWVAHGMVCESEEIGLRCANGEGRGFLVSRSRLELF